MDENQERGGCVDMGLPRPLPGAEGGQQDLKFHFDTAGVHTSCRSSDLPCRPAPPLKIFQRRLGAAATGAARPLSQASGGVTTAGALPSPPAGVRMAQAQQKGLGLGHARRRLGTFRASSPRLDEHIMDLPG